MTEILLVVGAAALIILWQRLKAVEQQLDMLRDELAHGAHHSAPEVIQQPTAASYAEDVEESGEGSDVSRTARVSGVTIVSKSTPEPESVSASQEDVGDVAEDRSASRAEPQEEVVVSVAPEQESEPPKPFFERFSFDFEELVGRRLSIWAGGIALAISGIFLVLYSIEQGLLSPIVRVALSFLFGFALLAGAELAHRFENRLADPRVRQALAGAGLATLYAAFYLAGTTYGLIGAGVAFAGLAAATAGAIALSYRYGLPCAILGLVGGFAAPALVSSAEPNIPLLTVYLGLVTTGLAYTGQRQNRSWLGLAALGGGFLWGLVLLLSGIEGTSAVASVGLLIVGLGALVPMLLSSLSDRPWQRLGAAGVASVQMAALVFDAGFAALTWGLYLLLAAAIAFLGWRNRGMREANGVVGAVGVNLLLLWLDPESILFAIVAAAIAAISLAVPVILLWRREARTFDIWQIALGAPALAFAIWFQFGFDMTTQEKLLIAGSIAILALIPAIAARILWKRGEHSESVLVAAIASTAALLFGGAMIALPTTYYPLAAAPIALALVYLCTHRKEGLLPELAWIGAVVAALSVFAYESVLDDEVVRAFGDAANGWSALAAVRWIVAALPFAALVWLEGSSRRHVFAEVVACLFGYVAIAQLAREPILPWLPALTAIALAWWLSQRRAAANTLAVIAGLWAFMPAIDWADEGINALIGDPMLATALPGPLDVITYLLPFALAAIFLGFIRTPNNGSWPHAWLAFGMGAGMIALHSLYKQIFGIDTITHFVELGLLERTVWQAVLGAIGIALAQGRIRDGMRQVGLVLIGLSLAHFACFTLVLHNPLWYDQAIGPVPIANLALAAYAVALTALLQLDRLGADQLGRFRIFIQPAAMFLIAMLALTLLRQIFAGSVMPPVPMSGTEDLLRSLLGILLAGAFLAWGARTGERSWRIGSMVLMVIAVLKVFLVDAADLEGLLRIASFMALGFSLIGIGWVYSRQLGSRNTAIPE